MLRLREVVVVYERRRIWLQMYGDGLPFKERQLDGRLVWKEMA